MCVFQRLPNLEMNI
nr:unnamed protein product [Callosobruchus analis]